MEPDRYAMVLVALMKDQRDLAIARDQHWYRMPLKHVPRRGVNAPIIAFYQAKAFDAQKWSINYYAHTVGWEVAPRIELLPDEPDHPRAHDLYYKVHLKDLRSLPHAIVSQQWRRITFIVTHWGRLESAYEIKELLHGSIWEERLWRALRRMGRLSEEEEPDDW